MMMHNSDGNECLTNEKSNINQHMSLKLNKCISNSESGSLSSSSENSEVSKNDEKVNEIKKICIQNEVKEKVFDDLYVGMKLDLNNVEESCKEGLNDVFEHLEIVNKRFEDASEVKDTVQAISVMFEMAEMVKSGSFLKSFEVD